MLGLFLSVHLALAATMWSVSSCRFVSLQFTTDTGSFADFYLDETADGAPVDYQNGIGLFTWLKPFLTDAPKSWTEGSCTGYTELQREFFTDSWFETARICAVLAVLGSMGVTVWTWFLACIALTSQIQIYAMVFLYAILTIAIGLTFLMLGSKLCNELTADQGFDGTTSCSLDQGGLVACAAILLWTVAGLITFVYVKPIDREIVLVPSSQEQQRLRQKRILAERQKQAALSSSPDNNSSVANKKYQAALAQQQQSKRELLAKQQARQQAQQSKKNISIRGVAAEDGTVEMQLQRNHRGQLSMMSRQSQRRPTSPSAAEI